MAFALLLGSGCANASVQGVSDIKWSKQLGGNITYGSVAGGTNAISADVPPAQVRACLDGLIKGLADQDAPADVNASRRLAGMSDDLTDEMVRLLRDTGSTFLVVEKAVYRFAVSNTRPYMFNCRTPFGTASFPLRARWSRPREL
jgi:hypothetical protein